MKRISPGIPAHLAGGSVIHVVDVLNEEGVGAGPSLVLTTHGLFGLDVVAPLTPQEAARLPQATVAPSHGRGYLWWPVT